MLRSKILPVVSLQTTNHTKKLSFNRNTTFFINKLVVSAVDIRTLITSTTTSKTNNNNNNSNKTTAILTSKESSSFIVTKKLYDVNQHVWYQPYYQQQPDVSIDRSLVGSDPLLKKEKQNISNINNDDTTRNHLLLLQMGITEYGLSHLGDITSIALCSSKLTTTIRQSPQVPSNNNDNTIENNLCTIQVGEPLLHIHWEAYTQTYADELYHTVWESIEGTKVINSFVSGKIIVSSIIPDPQKEDIDEDTVLVEILCTTDEWNNQFLLQQQNNVRRRQQQSSSSSSLLRSSSWLQQRQLYDNNINNNNINDSTVTDIVDNEQIYNSIIQQLPPGKFTS